MYKSPNVYYLGDPVLTSLGRGTIKKFGKRDYVWVLLERDERIRPDYFTPFPFSELRRLV